MPTTPLRRASSVGLSSTQRSRHHTPTAFDRENGLARKGGSARRTVATTPHGRAAQRELDIRRAGLTPGKDRRRSGRQQRETPRDTLRLLSRRLAGKSTRVVSTPQGLEPLASRLAASIGEDDIDDPLPDRPRLSLALGENEDEDDSLLLPPRPSALEDDNLTMQSIELGRRAFSEQLPGRFSRGSFGSILMSDNFSDTDYRRTSAVGIDRYDSSYLPGDAGEHDIPDMFDLANASLQEDFSRTLHNFGRRAQNSLTPNRNSDIRATEATGDDTETTFVLNVLPREPPTEVGPDYELSETEALAIPDATSPQTNVEINSEFPHGGATVWDEVVSTEGPYERTPVTVVESMSREAPIHANILPKKSNTKQKAKRNINISKNGNQYHFLPAGVVKKLATTFARTAGNKKSTINKDALAAIMQASNWFFEQMSEDLGMFAKHAGRKTIDESDVTTLLSRQHQISETTTPFSLAQKSLPGELIQYLRMVPPSKACRDRRPTQKGDKELG